MDNKVATKHTTAFTRISKSISLYPIFKKCFKHLYKIKPKKAKKNPRTPYSLNTIK